MGIKTKKFSQLSATSDGKLILANDNKLYQSTSSLSELVPSTAGLATETDLQTVSGALSNYEQKITYGYDENKAITAINNSAIGGTGGGGGASYIAGQGIKIDNNTISISSTGCSVTGAYAFAEGQNNSAHGNYSHAEGNQTSALGLASHAEGQETKAIGAHSHAEGYATKTSDEKSHAEGMFTIAFGKCSHAEGESTKASGYASHAEGQCTSALSNYSHAEGYYTIADYSAMHVGGALNKTSSDALFVLGNGNVTIQGGQYVWNRSDAFIVYPDGSVSAAGKISANGVELGAGGAGVGDMEKSKLEYSNNKITGYDGSAFAGGGGDGGDYVPLSALGVAIGTNNSANNNRAFAQGSANTASDNSFAQGNQNVSIGNAFSQGWQTSANNYSLTQGVWSYTNDHSMVQGQSCSANSTAFAQGQNCSAYNKSFAQGVNVVDVQDRSFGQGDGNRANNCSFAQGQGNLASGVCFAQGVNNTAYNYSFVQGQDNAIGDSSDMYTPDYSFGHGYENTAYQCSFIHGKTNSAKSGAFVIGEGNKGSTNCNVLGYKNTFSGDTYDEYDIIDSAASIGSLVIGKFNKTTANAFFVIGNGKQGNMGAVTKNDALVVSSDSRLIVSGIDILATLSAIAGNSTALFVRV